jgi:hypothetical protein
MFELRSSGLYSHNTTQFLVQASAGKLSACAYVLPTWSPRFIVSVYTVFWSSVIVVENA